MEAARENELVMEMKMEPSFYKSYITTANAMERLQRAIETKVFESSLDAYTVNRRDEIRLGTHEKCIQEVVGSNTGIPQVETPHADSADGNRTSMDGHQYLAKLRRLQYQLYNSECERLRDVEKRYDTDQQLPSENYVRVGRKSPPKSPTRWNKMNSKTTPEPVKSVPSAEEEKNNIRRLDTPTRHKRMQRRRDAEIRRRRRPKSPPKIDLAGRCLMDSPAGCGDMWHVPKQLPPSRRSAPASTTFLNNFSDTDMRPLTTANGLPSFPPSECGDVPPSASKVVEYFNIRQRGKGLAAWNKMTQSAEGGLQESLKTLKLPTLQRSRSQLLAAGGGGGLLAPEKESTDRLNNRSNQLQRLKLSRKFNGQKLDDRMRSYSYTNPRMSKKTNTMVEKGSRSVDYVTINVSIPRMNADAEPQLPNIRIPQMSFELPDGQRNTPVSSMADFDEHSAVPDICVREASPVQPPSSSSSRNRGGAGPLMKLARQNELRDKEVKNLMQDISELKLTNEILQSNRSDRQS